MSFGHCVDSARAPATSSDRLGRPPTKRIAGCDVEHELDSARALQLLLRRAVHDAGEALLVDGPTRSMRIVIAAQRLASACREAVALAAVARVDWAHVEHELAGALVAGHKLGHELQSRQLGGEATELQQGIDQLEGLVDPDTLAGAQAANRAFPYPPVTASEQGELARHAMAAVRIQAGVFVAQRADEDPAKTVLLFEPLLQHLATAADAVGATDRTGRKALVPDVEQVSQALDAVAIAMAVEPKLPWHRTYATAFDSENQIRKALGRDPRHRPYSGTVDPAKAAELIKGAAQGARDENVAKLPFVTPAAAVEGIGLGLGYVFDTRLQWVTDLDVTART
jgi:hypothetical protein